MSWRETLSQAGIGVDVRDAQHVILTDHRTSKTMVAFVKSASEWFRASKLKPPPEHPALLRVPRATRQAIGEARERGWFVVTDEGDADLVIGGRHVVVDARRSRTSVQKADTTTTWSLFTVARVLASMAAIESTFSIVQTRLATVVGVSQPTVHRALKQLSSLDLIEMDRRWLTVPDVNRLIEWWLTNYPGPGGLSSYWYGLEGPRDQVIATASALDTSHDGDPPATRIAVTGEVAADALASWQVPNRAHVYANGHLPLARVGFVPVDTPEAATLVVTVPADPGVWLRDVWLLSNLKHRIEAADPLQVLYDLKQDKSAAAVEAQDHLLRALLRPLAHRWQAHRI